MIERALSVLALMTACSPADDAARAWSRGAVFLAGQQRADGAIGSEHYGVLREGRSTTAVALCAFAMAPRYLRVAHRPTIERAFAYLWTQVDASGAVVGDGSALDYPNYSAAMLLLAVAELRPPGHAELTHRLIERLRRVQFAAARGVLADDPAYGGFDLGADARPISPGDAPGVDVSVTAWVLDGIHAAGVTADDPLVVAARAFVERCQPWPGDGGFLFAPSDDHRPPKAGSGVTYGTATADGLRALIACGATLDDPRAQAALVWLEERFAVDRVPGFARGHPYEPALRIYWCCAASRAFAAAGGHGELRARLAAHVRALQRDDGSFVGDSAIMKEDDPLVATPLALLALGAAEQ